MLKVLMVAFDDTQEDDGPTKGNFGGVTMEEISRPFARPILDPVTKT